MNSAIRSCHETRDAAAAVDDDEHHLAADA
jgi:hypothetical protein